MKKNYNWLAILSILSLLTLLLVACGNTDNADAGANVDYPTEDISFIVPFSPGGGTDAAARSIASAIEKQLEGSTIGIINQTGGSGAVGMTEGALASPDGYTITMITEGVVVLPHLGQVTFQPEDFRGVGMVNFDPSAITVPIDSPFNTVDEFLDYAEQNPDELRVGTSAPHTIWDLALSQLETVTGLSFTHVPYEAGGAEAVKDLLGGHLDAVTVSPGEVLQQVEGGKLKTLAVMSNERMDVMEDVPTLKESGIDVEIGVWRGIAVPKDTPDEIVNILSEATVKATEDQDFQEFMNNNGFGIQVKNAEEFAEHISQSNNDFGELLDTIGAVNNEAD